MTTTTTLTTMTTLFSCHSEPAKAADRQPCACEESALCIASEECLTGETWKRIYVYGLQLKTNS
jgi:hypothetical protein